MMKRNGSPTPLTKTNNCKHGNWACIRKSRIYHAVHCCVFVVLLVGYDLLFGKAYRYFSHTKATSDESLPLLMWIMYVIRSILAVGWLPYICMVTGGIFFFNAYETEVECIVRASEAPFLCFRIVTRGMYPQVVRNNVKHLLNLLASMGLKHYVIQVVTDIDFILEVTHSKVKMLVVPAKYNTKRGSRYKARALQYCLEHSNVILKDNDWIVHLDEETVVTMNSVRGILNFVTDGRYQFGQGLITYIGDRVDNWFTSLLDAWRVADDMGKQRLQLSVFHRLVLEWKGSFFVSKAGAEKMVSFDHGEEGSIVEDGYFGLRATQDGYKFNFIQGNMWERSPASVSDLLKQRKRWVQGGYLITRSSGISWCTKLFFNIHFWTLTLSLGGFSTMVFSIFFPTPFPSMLDVFDTYIFCLVVFMSAYGVLYSYLLYSERHYGILLLTMVLSILLAPINNVMLGISIIIGLLGKKDKFYIVKKFE